MSQDHIDQESNNYGTASDGIRRLASEDPKFQNTVETAIQTFDAQEAVSTLRRDVLDITKYFEEIHNSISHLDRRFQKVRARRIAALNLLGFAPPVNTEDCLNSWDSIKGEYQTLVWESRRIATTAAQRAEMFREEVIERLRDPFVSLTEKKSELGDFIADMKKTDELAQKMSDGFLGIPSKIRRFQQLFGESVAVHVFKDKQRIDKKIKLLNTQIEKLVEKIDKYNAEHDMAWKTLRTAISSKLGSSDIEDDILMTFGALLGPAGRESLLSKLFNDMKARAAIVISDAELSRAQEQLQKKQEALQSLQTDAANLQHVIPGYVEIAKVRTVEVCNRLKAIAQVWAIIRRDAQFLYEYMEVAERSTEKRFEEYLSERQRIVPLYKKLEEILKDYAIAIV
ncbi:hypothetical protein OPQ81_008360 [Rhizoctonia solani]|nr:hypothetical protein OPQ81_008360 [Rhizoctonia solani]